MHRTSWVSINQNAFCERISLFDNSMLVSSLIMMRVDRDTFRDIASLKNSSSIWMNNFERSQKTLNGSSAVKRMTTNSPIWHTFVPILLPKRKPCLIWKSGPVSSNPWQWSMRRDSAHRNIQKNIIFPCTARQWIWLVSTGPRSPFRNWSNVASLLNSSGVFRITIFQYFNLRDFHNSSLPISTK